MNLLVIDGMAVEFAESMLSCSRAYSEGIQFDLYPDMLGMEYWDAISQPNKPIQYGF